MDTRMLMVGATICLRGGDRGTITEILDPSKGPRWEQKVGGRDVFVDSEFNLDNVERWGAALALDIDGRRVYADWKDIDMSTLVEPAPKVATHTPGLRLQLPTQGQTPKAPVATAPPPPPVKPVLSTSLPVKPRLLFKKLN